MCVFLCSHGEYKIRLVLIPRRGIFEATNGCGFLSNGALSTSLKMIIYIFNFGNIVIINDINRFSSGTVLKSEATWKRVWEPGF